MQILRASAGSGKTYALAYEYIKNVIKTPEKYSSILAVTFTNKATDEMKHRILKELDELRSPLTPQRHSYLDRLTSDLKIDETTVAQNAKRALSYILHDYSRFSVLTIDRFFQKILRAFVKELGVETDYSVDFNTEFIVDLSIDKLVDRSKGDDELAKNIKEFSDELIENSKSYNLKQSLAKFAYNIFSENFDTVHADENRERYIQFYKLVSESEKVIKTELVECAKRGLAVIFDSGLSINDFPYKGKGLANYLLKISESEFKKYNSYVEKSLDASYNWKTAERVKGDLLPILTDVCRLWDEHKKFLCSAEIFSKNYRKFLLLNDIAFEVDDICVSSNIMLLSTTTRLLSSLTSENDAPFIYEKCGNSYEIFMIDEFQDTSVRQWRNFAPLINNALAQCDEFSKCVTIVGDIKQSIYRWRGGDWKLLQGDLKDDVILHDKISEMTLDTNWRSSRVVVGFNNAVVGGVSSLLNQNLNDVLDEMKGSDYISVNQRNELYDTLKNAYYNAEQKYAPKNSVNSGYVSITECDFGKQENLLKMVNAIKSIQDRGLKAQDIAIITRTNSQAKSVVEYLLSQKDMAENENYCFDAISNQALYLTNSVAVRFIITILRLGVVNFEDNSLIVAEYNKYQSKEFNSEIPEHELEVIAKIRELSIVEAFEKIVSHFSPAKTVNDVAYIQALYEQIIGFSIQNITDVAMFLEWWDKEKQNLSITLPDGQNAINVITIHSAKGLEYDTVLVPYFDWSLEPKSSEQIWVEQNSEPFDIVNSTIVPYSGALSESHFAYSYAKERVMAYVDNVNTLYVAITRAAKELYLMIPETPIKNSVAEALKNVLKIGDDKVSIVGNSVDSETVDSIVDGRVVKWLVESDIERNEYVFGEKIEFILKNKKFSDSVIVDELKSIDYHKNNRIQLRYSTERYYEDESGEKRLTPRSYGILMHKLFERIEHFSDIDSELNNMCVDGIMTTDECGEISTLISNAFKNSDIVQFFDTDWSVKNEQNILMPLYDEKVVHLRPDRVIVSNERAKVLDYKFGSVKNDKNLSQMSHYVDILKKMGYKDVVGYVWYVKLNEVDRVV